MALKTRKFDVAKFLETDQDIALYLSEALETGDAAYVAHAFGAVARARGMAKVARQTGLGRESLYKALSGEGNPELATVLRVAKALGLELAAKPVSARQTRAKSAKPKKAKRNYAPRRAA
jgi:probable addiction module antidote protein